MLYLSVYILCYLKLLLLCIHYSAIVTLQVKTYDLLLKSYVFIIQQYINYFNYAANTPVCDVSMVHVAKANAE